MRLTDVHGEVVHSILAKATCRGFGVRRLDELCIFPAKSANLSGGRKHYALGEFTNRS
jgi:hypothetical protein